MPAFCGAVRPSDSLSQQTVTNRNEPLAAGATFGSGPERRHRLRHWQHLGLVPWQVAPAAVAAAHVRATGRPPARDPERKASRAYSRLEVAVAMAELGYQPAPPPPADPLALVWSAALARVPLPSTRMLLSQQCRLLELRHDRSPLASRGDLVAVVAVRPGWLDMVRARVDLIANALNEALAACVAVEPVEVEVGQ